MVLSDHSPPWKTALRQNHGTLLAWIEGNTCGIEFNTCEAKGGGEHSGVKEKVGCVMTTASATRHQPCILSAIRHHKLSSRQIVLNLNSASRPPVLAGHFRGRDVRSTCSPTHRLPPYLGSCYPIDLAAASCESCFFRHASEAARKGGEGEAPAGTHESWDDTIEAGKKNWRYPAACTITALQRV